jgi:TRAP transporter 4TM/12TM fusion protein
MKLPWQKTKEELVEEGAEATSKRTLHGLYRAYAFILGFSLTIFVFYTAFFGVFLPMIQIGIALGVLLALSFLWIPAGKASPRSRPSAPDMACSLLALACGIYTVLNNARFIARIPYYSEILFWDKVVAIILIVLVLEVSRRTVGLAMSIIAGVFIVYAFLGGYMPAMLMHRGFTLNKLVDCLYLTTEGFFGSMTAICAGTLFVFISFGVFLQETGGDKRFMDIALSVAGHKPGGPAKVAVLSSGCMGMISGSTVANVVTTGTLTIPLMKKIGYTPEEAGAVETVASSGGQVTPPIMGTVAFLIADGIGVAYWDVVKVSFLPALLFYLTVWFFVDTKARKKGMRGLARENLPLLGRSLLTCAPMIVPIIVLCTLLVMKYTPALSAAVCCLLILAMAACYKDSRLSLKQLALAIEKCSISMTSVIGVMACASIIVAIMSKTGFLLKSTSIVMLLGGGKLMGIVLINIVMSYVIGMGLPSASCYIILSALGAPALISLGVTPIAAHLLIFWFTQLAGITPPVCITAFVAAGIAGSSPMKTGFTALEMGSTFYLVPFLFLFTPLVNGTPAEMVVTALITALAFYMMVSCIENYLYGAFTPLLRVLCGLTSVCLFFASFTTTSLQTSILMSVAGIAASLAIGFYQKRRASRSAA